MPKTESARLPREPIEVNLTVLRSFAQGDDGQVQERCAARHVVAHVETLRSEVRRLRTRRDGDTKSTDVLDEAWSRFELSISQKLAPARKCECGQQVPAEDAVWFAEELALMKAAFLNEMRAVMGEGSR